MDDDKLMIALILEYYKHISCARDYLNEGNLELKIAHKGGATAIRLLIKELFGEDLIKKIRDDDDDSESVQKQV